jgi:hypothetical protein
MFVGLAAVVAMVFVGAPAQAEPHSIGATTQTRDQAEPHNSSVTTQVGDQVEPFGLGEGTDILETYGYKVTLGRFLACGVAALGRPSTERAIAACTVGLLATRVGLVVAGIACTACALA